MFSRGKYYNVIFAWTFQPHSELCLVWWMLISEQKTLEGIFASTVEALNSSNAFVCLYRVTLRWSAENQNICILMKCVNIDCFKRLYVNVSTMLLNAEKRRANIQVATDKCMAAAQCCAQKHELRINYYIISFCL